ncbi:unnamed protein product [Amoebophrya sp. A120]|nr:unnamed protein product [Amoebophrya sp. A120]|eukprot:GSA120T00021524001.1
MRAEVPTVLLWRLGRVVTKTGRADRNDGQDHEEHSEHHDEQVVANKGGVANSLAAIKRDQEEHHLHKM